MDLKDKERVVLEFLLLKECMGDEIATCLQNVFEKCTYFQATIFQWIKEVCSSTHELRNEGRLGRLCHHEIDAIIQSILWDEPNASLRIIAETLGISLEMVRTHLSMISYTLKVLRWIPHPLISELK
jgi:DNA-binding NarL/FixJ family response regulator